tara:strand:+ start:1960 stop:2253 length:294 start_codon:yes stop_codon:yes gene_type:complete
MGVNAKEHRNVIDEVARLNKVEIEFLWEVLKNSMIPGRNIHIAYDVINKLKRQHQIQGVDKKDLKLSKDKVVNPKSNEEKARQILQEKGGELFVKDE